MQTESRRTTTAQALRLIALLVGAAILVMGLSCGHKKPLPEARYRLVVEPTEVTSEVGGEFDITITTSDGAFDVERNVTLVEWDSETLYLLPQDDRVLVEVHEAQDLIIAYSRDDQVEFNYIPPEGNEDEAAQRIWYSCLQEGVTEITINNRWFEDDGPPVEEQTVSVDVVCDVSSGVCNRNGVAEGLEDCDGTDLRGATCESLGFDGGDLFCDGHCEYDTEDCTSSESCEVPEGHGDMVDVDWVEQLIANLTEASDGIATALAEAETDVCRTADGVASDTEIRWDVIEGPGFGYTFEPSGMKGEGDGDHVVIAVALVADFPGDGATEHYQYGFVFDRDGDAANNYVPHPSYPSDFFSDTDRWYQLLHTPGTGWSLTVQDIVDGAPVDIASDAMVVAVGNTLTLLVPLSELGGDASTISYRFSAFRHDGTWLAGPWNGDVVPTVAEGLQPLVP